jgi:hypothetical protein
MPSRSSHALLFAALAAACGDSAQGPGPAGAAADGGSAMLTFTLQHACGTQPIQVRFFDKANNIVWPSASTTIALEPGKTESYTLKCIPGARICFGAAQADSVWGVTLANSRECQACCAVCTNERLPGIRLDCP